MPLKVVILAAGKGTRMVADLPKVIHPLGGIPLLGHVIDAVQSLDPAEILVVYSPDLPEVRQTLAEEKVTWVQQAEQLGTGHAVLQAASHFEEGDRILVLYGDVPLITRETLEYLVSSSPEQGVGLLVAKVDDPTGLGRIIRNADGHIVRIVEHKDANPSQRRVKEINTGIMTMPASLFNQWLPGLGKDNQQGEYYLTDLIAKAVENKRPIFGVQAFSAHEIQGVNNRWQLARLERYYQELMAKRYSLQGVAIKDYQRFDVRGREVEIGSDVEIDINVVLSGKVSIGSHSYIGPNVIIENSRIGKGVRIEANTVIRGAIVEDHALIGPFVHLRAGSRLGKRTALGNFVEVKNSCLGEGTVAKHLSYMGDSVIGKYVNIGAGMITCNYDGRNKHKTEIGDDTFVGANTTLVAPIKIGSGATVAAGTTLTKSLSDNALGIAREPQKEVKNFGRKKK
jgi:bifunctional UDP-N-acetylglucosamine pyrophosphorylase / glucosamine-1-phosphate N-acetyltransferase